MISDKLSKRLIAKGFIENEMPETDIPLWVEQYQLRIDSSKILYYTHIEGKYVDTQKGYHLWDDNTKTKIFFNTNHMDFVIKCAKSIDVEEEPIEGEVELFCEVREAPFELPTSRNNIVN